MAASVMVGSVAELWRFPVKSMKGERLERAQLTEAGLVGDRAYALIDVDTGKVVSAKSVKLFPNLLACRAAFIAPPQAGREVPPVRIDLPDVGNQRFQRCRPRAIGVLPTRRQAGAGSAG
jgi:hypothetical protein